MATSSWDDPSSFAPAESGELSAGDYVPSKAREYKEIMDIIHRRDRSGDGERYNALMSKERRVLDTVDRVVNDARLQQVRRRSFLDMSLVQIILRTAEVLHDMYLEAFAVRSLDDLTAIFARPERRVYIGLVIVVIALFLGFLQMIVLPPFGQRLPPPPFVTPPPFSPLAFCPPSLPPLCPPLPSSPASAYHPHLLPNTAAAAPPVPGGRSFL